MEGIKKRASALLAFSLAAFLFMAAPALAANVTGSEFIDDPEGDAAASGETQTEEASASAGLEEDGGDEEDVLATVTGESVTPAEEEQEAAEGGTSEEEETASAGIKEEEAAEEPEAYGTEEEPEAREAEETAASGTEEEPEAWGTDEEPEAEESRLPFADVPVGHWSYEYVLYAYENDLVRGVSETAFNPTGVMTRAAFVTTLYRFSAKLGGDMSQGEASFTDIDDINDEFHAAVLWGAAHGIVTGRADGTFAPRENVTRQQMCAILTRYLRDYLRLDLSAYAGGADEFADGDTISDYAKEAVSIMRNMGVIDGRSADGATVFDPAGSASRAAVVKVLSGAVQLVPELPALPEEPEEEEPENTGESVESGETVTDNGDSGTDAKTDTDKSSGSSSGGSSGSSGGSSGGSSSGGSGGSSGGSSSGGSGGTSGGNSSGGNTTPVTPVVIVEPENADTIFGYLDEILAAYENNPPQKEPAITCMGILMRDLKSVKAVRDMKTVLVDAEYVKTHYAEDIEELMGIYRMLSITQRLELAEYMRTLASPTQKLMDVLEYFDLLEMLI